MSHRAVWQVLFNASLTVDMAEPRMRSEVGKTLYVYTTLHL